MSYVAPVGKAQYDVPMARCVDGTAVRRLDRSFGESICDRTILNPKKLVYTVAHLAFDLAYLRVLECRSRHFGFESGYLSFQMPDI